MIGQLQDIDVNPAWWTLDHRQTAHAIHFVCCWSAWKASSMNGWLCP